MFSYAPSLQLLSVTQIEYLLDKILAIGTELQDV
jgi:hypothetical protein